MTRKPKIIVRPAGIGFFGAAFLILMTLKLTGFIAWSWWVLFAVLFAPLLLVGAIALFAGAAFLVGGAAFFLAGMVAGAIKRKRRKRL